MADPVVLTSGGGGGTLFGGDGPPMLAGFGGASEFSTGDTGGSIGFGVVTKGGSGVKKGDAVAIAPGIEVPAGDPYASYPAGREQATTINLSSTTASGSVSGEVRVPEWAVSFNVYVDGKMGTAVAQIREGPLNYTLRQAFATNVSVSAGAGVAGGCSRGNPCTPGTALVGVTTTADAAADTGALLIFVFSPGAASV